MITYIGLLRLLLAALTLALIATAPFAELDAGINGVQLYTNVIGPALTMIVFFVLLLDMLMTRVFMAEKQDSERERYKRILYLEMSLLCMLLLSWAPFIRALVALDGS